MGSERRADYYLGDRARGILLPWDGPEFVRIWVCSCLLRTPVGQMGKKCQGVILDSIY